LQVKCKAHRESSAEFLCKKGHVILLIIHSGWD